LRGKPEEGSTSGTIPKSFGVDVVLSFFAWLSLSATLICIGLALAVYFLNRKALLNKLFAVTVLAIAYWSFSEFMVRISANADYALFWGKVGFMWPFFSALHLNFTIAFTESNLLKNHRNYLLLYLPAVFFSLADLFTDQISGSIVLQSWGYSYSPPISWLNVVCNVWSGALAYFALFLCITYYNHAQKPLKRQQAKFIALAFAVPTFTFLITQILLPRLGWAVPEMGNAASAVTSGFVAYAILKVRVVCGKPCTCCREHPLNDA
jgi:hypothetical protein